MSESEEHANASKDLVRCDWALGDPLLLRYHDEEWGVPSHDDRHLFELLILEGAQAGLSWLTVLRKRDGYREAFENFEPSVVASFAPEKAQELIDGGLVIRNRAKIESAIRNAQALCRVAEEQGSFSTYVWAFVDGRPIQNSWQSTGEIPPSTDESMSMSKDLRKRGFSFVGPTICYAFMEAAGLVNDHIASCFRYLTLSEVPAARRSRSGTSSSRDW